MRRVSNPDPLDFVQAYLTVALVAKAGSCRVRMPAPSDASHQAYGQFGDQARYFRFDKAGPHFPLIAFHTSASGRWTNCSVSVASVVTSRKARFPFLHQFDAQIAADGLAPPV